MRSLRCTEWRVDYKYKDGDDPRKAFHPKSRRPPGIGLGQSYSHQAQVELISGRLANLIGQHGVVLIMNQQSPSLQSVVEVFSALYRANSDTVYSSFWSMSGFLLAGKR